MPYKDPAKAKAQKRAYYLANKEAHLESTRRRRIRLQEERALQKTAAGIGPIKPPLRYCVDCGSDITFSYKSKYGARCKPCVAIYMKAYREANKERIAAKKKAWVDANREHKAAKDRGYAQANPAARKAARKKWVETNPGKDVAAKALNRIARKKRVPGWLSSDDLWMISQAYELAAARTELFGFSWHVDHKIPLNGRTVSGLHVPLNLQVIPWIDNLRKGNRA